MDFSGTERRKYPRLACHFLVHYYCVQDKGNMEISQLKDLSLGGAFFTSHRQFDKGTELSLQIRLPNNSSPVVSNARVIDSGVGANHLVYQTRVEFLPMEKYDSEILGQVITDFLNAKKASSSLKPKLLTA